jgi:hypothetical protein
VSDVAFNDKSGPNVFHIGMSTTVVVLAIVHALA